MFFLRLFRHMFGSALKKTKTFSFEIMTYLSFIYLLRQHSTLCKIRC